MAYTKKKNLIAIVFDKVPKEFFERDASDLCCSQETQDTQNLSSTL